ncbi:uncharacterized protein [Rutidosis leptorrhynchoides]|uniref:uncharacterized protein n=1 Tax=Rutidosis leptorrhynchoides TaxID=125765 RepID=UPI003A9919D1
MTRVALDNGLPFLDIIAVDELGDHIGIVVRNQIKDKYDQLLKEQDQYLIKNAFVCNNPNKNKLAHWLHQSKVMITNKSALIPVPSTEWNGNDGFKFIPFSDLITCQLPEKATAGTDWNFSRIYIDTDLPAIKEFKQSLEAMCNKDDSEHTLGPSLTPALTPPVKSLDDWFTGALCVQCCDLSFENTGIFIVHAEIIAIEPDEPWSYIACKKCHKKANTVSKEVDLTIDIDEQLAFKHKCSACGENPHVVVRFKVSVRVADENGVATLTLFESQVLKYVKESAYTLTKSLPEDQDFPIELDALLNNTLLFKLEIDKLKISTLSIKDDSSELSMSAKCGSSSLPTEKNHAIDLSLNTGFTPRKKFNSAVKIEDDQDLLGTEYHPIEINPLIEPKTESDDGIDDPQPTQFCKVFNDGKNIYVWMTMPGANIWRLPEVFNLLPQLKSRMKITVIDLDGFPWTWGLINEGKKGKKKLCVSAGWESYIKAHGLKVGNQVIFGFDIIKTPAEARKHRKEIINAKKQPKNSHINAAYYDEGDLSYTCSACGAKLWKKETKCGESTKGLPGAFSQCCLKGRIKLSEFTKEPPQLLMDLYTNKHPKSKHVIENVRQYNMVFAFTSMGGKVDNSVNHEDQNKNFKIKLIARRTNDGRNYNLPTVDEVVALIVGDIDLEFDKRDIVIDSQKEGLMRISELHPHYLALQYPLLFAYAEDGYRPNIYHQEIPGVRTKKPKRVTMREFFAYKIQERSLPTLVHLARKLHQQLLVDAYTMVESERIYCIRLNKRIQRADTFSNLTVATLTGDVVNSMLGNRVKLPLSFTGSARYMIEKYRDAMALCRVYGYPDLFITFSCNSKWPEITRALEDTGFNPEDRPAYQSRMFKIKLDRLMDDIKRNRIFGKVTAELYTIEFQKRGLPHAHICIFLDEQDKLPEPGDIDEYISAEIPDKDADPELYQLVSELMIHGLCDTEGYPVYRRRDNGRKVSKQGHDLDNGSVVPYNAYLLKKYQAHINIKWCNQVGAIRYLFKYIHKGDDRVTVGVYEEETDEIKQYYDCRYVSSCEAVWRILAFDIHHRNPTVIWLAFHLEDQQSVIFDEQELIEDLLDAPSVNTSQFLEWMLCNQKMEAARSLIYVEFPTKFVWNKDTRKWTERKKFTGSIGRIHHVSPQTGELFYLRILLNKVKGPKCYEDIRTVNGQIYPTFKSACYAMGLLDDDQEYIDAIKDASQWGS